MNQIISQAEKPAAECPVTIFSTQDRDPFPLFEHWRGMGPLVRDEVMGGLIVLGFDACVEVETNEDRFRHPYADADELLAQIKGGWSNLVLLTGEAHAKLRHFHMKLLSNAAVASYREQFVLPILDMLIKRIEGRGQADLVHAIAEELPPRVILGLFGMPWEDDALVARILALHEDIMAWVGNRNSGEEHTRKAIEASAEINALLLPYIRMRRQDPKDDFISRVWKEAPSEYGEMTDADVLGVCRELFLGGSDTTVHAIANAYYLLLTRPDLRAAVDADRQNALNSFVEETMRLYGSVQYRFRISNEDTVLGGAPVKKDEVLILMHSAANRDPARFGCPHEADLDRPRVKDHLAFNKGPRTCVGLGLARSELRDVVEALLDRLPNVQLDPSKEPPRFAGLFMRSFKPLHVRFDAKA